MKIKNTEKKGNTANVGNASQAGKSGNARTTSTSTNADQSSVNVSLSSQLQELTAEMASSDVFDTQKVDEIKAAIAEGNFNVDTDKVADSLIESVKEMLKKGK